MPKQELGLELPPELKLQLELKPLLELELMLELVQPPQPSPLAFFLLSLHPSPHTLHVDLLPYCHLILFLIFI